MENVLVIGSNGFVGNALCRHLYEIGYHVVGAYHRNTEHLFASIDHLGIADALNKTIYDTVFITSAYIPKKDQTIQRDSLYNANVNLIERICTSLPSAKIILCSSVSVYDPSKNVLTEKSRLAPTTEYGISKLWGEKVVAKHPSFAIVRFSSIYGKGMNANTFLPQIIKSGQSSNKITLYGDGSRKQNYIFIKDAVSYLVGAAKYSGNGVFLATQSLSYSNKEVAGLLKTIHSNIAIEYKGIDKSPSYFYDNKLSRSQLGIFDEVLFVDGLKTCV